MSQTSLGLILSPEALYSCWVVERIAWREEYVVLRVARGEVPAILLLQPRVHALLCRRGGKIEGDGEQEEKAGEVKGNHQEKLPPCPHSLAATNNTSCNDPHYSLLTYRPDGSSQVFV